jgi:nucleoporin NUP82
MRYLGQTVEHLRSQIDAVKYGNAMAEAQVQIQTMEFHRQVRQVQQILIMLEVSRTKRCAAWKERVEKAKRTQEELLERLDRTLRVYMRNLTPELSEQETKWFEELKRMKSEVLGQGKYDGQSLRARTKLVSTTVERRSILFPVTHYITS